MIEPATATLIGAGILGGSSLLGGKKGGGKKGGRGSSAERAQADTARLQAQIASELFGQTGPLRRQLFGAPAIPGTPTGQVERGRALLEQQLRDDMLTPEERQALTQQLSQLESEAQTGGQPAMPGIFPTFLETGEIPPALRPVTGPAREGLEAQFARARENIIGRSGVRGGPLSTLLADLETDRARAVGSLEAELEAPVRQQLFSAATGAALGAPPTTISALSGAGATFGSIAAQAAARQQAAGESAGSATGLALKLAMKGRGGGGSAGVPALPNPWGA